MPVASIPVVAQTNPITSLEGLLPRIGWFLVGVATIILIGRFLLEPAVIRVVQARNRDNYTLQEAVSRYLRLVVLLVGLFVGLGAAGFTRILGGSALIFAAVTLALGVAGQAVIGSLVSGIALVVDPQFNIGNYIRWDGGEGEVRSITLRVTRVRTPDGGLVTIPNTTMTDESIVRPFESGQGRVTQRVAVAYDDDIDTALTVLAKTATALEHVQAEPEPTAVVDELGSDAVFLLITFWVNDPRRNRARVQTAFAREAKDALDAAGVTVSPATKRELTGQVAVEGKT